MNDHVLPYLKSYAALIGSIATALLAVYTADTTAGRVLTVVSVVATAIVTWAVPNKDPQGTHQDESVQNPEQRILGKALYSDAEPTTERPGGMRAPVRDPGDHDA